MAVADLRSYVAALEAAGRLARVRREVSLEHELADVAAALERTASGAGLFERPTGSPWSWQLDPNRAGRLYRALQTDSRLCPASAHLYRRGAASATEMLRTSRMVPWKR